VADKISFLCIDKRVKDPKTNQTYIVNDKGKYIILPPNIHSVPSLLVTEQKYRVIMGDDILKHYHPKMRMKNEAANPSLGEPSGFGIHQFGSFNSEHYTNYNMLPDELSAKGTSTNRQLYNYVSANDDILLINTQPDNYQPDKISSSLTLDVLQQKRMDEISSITQKNSHPFS
jgi:hypothetical protein